MSKENSSVSQVEVTKDRDGQRLDNFLAVRFKGVPRSVVYRVIRTGQVRVNGGRAKPATRLKTGDVVRIPPATVRSNKAGDIPPAVMQLLQGSICYEDDGVMVIDKPAGMAVHGGSGLSWGVIDAIRKMRPHMGVDLVHRLDRETSGCMLLALNGEALKSLGAQMQSGVIQKRYLCLLDGQLERELIEVREPIGKFERSGQRYMAVDAGGKDAHTTLRRLQDFGGFSFAEAHLHTGRTHQIRVHAHHLGLPLAGDKLYSPAPRQKFWKTRGLRRMFLHAHQVSFLDGKGNEQMVSCPLPGELKDLLEKLESGL